ncbi:MAG: hypothetical protein GPJ54_06765 [Candidatus Heimdallarchaeota archaeon]|nr:hypothetical protein [Candidatus Heimdallarchaeota archaeon]
MTHYEWDKNKRQFADFIPPVSGFIAGIIFIFGTLWAVFDYNTVLGGYDFLEQFFSELGVRNDYLKTHNDGTTEQAYAPVNPEIFNLSLIFAGFIMIPFFPFSYRQMRNKSRISRGSFLLAITFGAFAGPFLVGVGLVDLSVENTDILSNHHFWAFSLYLLISLASIFWLIGITFAKDLPYRTSKLIFLDYLLILALLANVTVSLLDNLEIVAVGDVPYFSEYPVEAYQKFMAYLFFFYYALIVGTRLSLVKYDNTPSRVEVKDGDYLDAPKKRHRLFSNSILFTYLIYIIIAALAVVITYSIDIDSLI